VVEGDRGVNQLSRPELHRLLFFILAGGLALILIVLLVIYSWPAPEVDETYGKMGRMGRKSLNGTWVLAQMVRQSGHSVNQSTRLSQTLKSRADCIVWFASDWEVPDARIIHWFEEWLRAKPGRTLIYVGRHFEAGPIYWKKILERFAHQYDPTLREIIAKRQEYGEEFLREAANKRGECAWFSYEPLSEVIRPKALEMHPRWRMPIDARKLEIELRSQMIPPSEAEVLVRSEKHVLVARLPRGQSQILLVNNGSFLLNMMLVNPEHRKLAARLVQAIDESDIPSPKQVYFLELPMWYRLPSGPLKEPSPYALLTVYPLNGILLHLFLLGVIFALTRFPRLGPGYEPDIIQRTSFDAHLTAMARWLQRTRDYRFVQEILAQWERINAPRSRGGPRPRRTGKSSLLRY